MKNGVELAALVACMFIAACTQQNAATPSDPPLVERAPEPPTRPVPTSIQAYTNMLMFDTSVRGDELRLEMQSSPNPNHSPTVEFEVYRRHVESLCMCLIGKMECDWSGEPINRITFLDVGGKHGYSFAGGEAECRSLGPLHEEESASFIRKMTSRY